ncbi:MAG TPA: hypothetical protein VEB18_01090 [Candidatus Paceibacterota bacterium]|nr:hypothetical protein [Candidatus Paceibacterota bacterium]
MQFSTRRVSILISLAIAAFCIITAFFLSGTARFPTASATSTEELLRAYATKDTDADLLPDWQEDLYGSDPRNPHSIDPSMTDKAAVEAGLIKPRFESEKPEPSTDFDLPGVDAKPETMTGRFARDFFGSYLTSRGPEAPTEEAMLAFIQEAIDDLEATRAALYADEELTIVPDSTEALTTYLIAGEAAINANSLMGARSELYSFADAVQKDDAAALAAVRASAKAYERIALALSRVAVPQSISSEHLAMVNAVATVGATIGDMGTFDTDPLRGFVGFDAYTEATRDMAAAFAGLYPSLQAAGIQLQEGEPGYQFYVIIERTAALPE